jgi:curved DNA-binding protein CbpA
MPNNPNYYDLLGVRPTASQEQLHAAYHAAIRHYHPDVNKAPNAVQITMMLNQAWDTLRDPLSRARYDRENGRRPEPVNPVQPQSARAQWSGAGWQQQQQQQQRAQWSGPYAQPGPQWSSAYSSQRRTTVAGDDIIGAMVGRVIGRTARLVGVIAVGIVGIALFTHLLPYVFPLAIGFFILRSVSCRR